MRQPHVLWEISLPLATLTSHQPREGRISDGDKQTDKVLLICISATLSPSAQSGHIMYIGAMSGSEPDTSIVHISHSHAGWLQAYDFPERALSGQKDKI